MALQILVAGVDRTSRLRAIQNLEVRYTLGGHGILNCELLGLEADTATAYRPAVDQLIVLNDGSTTLFSGTILAVHDSALDAIKLGVVTAIEAVDVQRAFTQRLLNISYAAGQTLKQVVSSIVSTYLSVYNVTLDAGMANGPTLEAQVFDLVSAQLGLNHLSDITGWVSRLLPTSVLEMFAPGTKTAAFSLTSSNATVRSGVQWSKQRGKYVNRQYVRYGDTRQVEKTDTFTGSALQSSYNLTYSSIANRGYITINGVYTNVGSGTNWVVTGTALQAVNPPANGDVIVVTYTVQFPQIVSAEDAGEITVHGPFEDLIDEPDIFEKPAALAIAAGLLRRYKVIPREIRLTTWQGLEFPGTTFTITIPERTVSGSWLITETVIRDRADGGLAYDYTCLEGSEAQDTWMEFWRSVVGGGGLSGFGGSVSGGVISQPPGLLGQLFLGAELIPPIITSDQHNYSATGWTTACAVMLESDTRRTITGFDASVAQNGEIRLLMNKGNFDITITAQDTNSAAANRVICPGQVDFTLKANDSVFLRYWLVAQRWFLIESVGSVTGLMPGSLPIRAQHETDEMGNPQLALVVAYAGAEYRVAAAGL